MEKIYRATLQTGEIIKIRVHEKLKRHYLCVEAYLNNKWVPGYYSTAVNNNPDEWINGSIFFDDPELPLIYRNGVRLLSKDVDQQLHKIYCQLKKEREMAIKDPQILSNLTNEELQTLKEEIERLLKERTTANATANGKEREYEFNIDITADPRKWYPYVAKLSLSPQKELQREFYNLNKTYGKHQVTLFGSITAKEGDVIEIRKGGSWKNEYRAAYLIKDGKMVEIADHKDSKGYAKIVKYLAGELKAEELLKEKEAKQ